MALSIRRVRRAHRDMARVEPLVRELEQLVRQRDPDARFSLEPAPDPGIWILNAFVTPPLDTDPDFLEAITRREVDLEIEHGVSVSTIPSPRERSSVPNA